MTEEKLPHALNMMLEVYVAGREEPLTWPMTMHVSSEVTKVSQVMDYAYHTINGVFDSRSEDHLLLIDPRGNHHMVFRDKIQCLSILAPDQESLTWVDNDEE